MYRHRPDVNDNTECPKILFKWDMLIRFGKKQQGEIPYYNLKSVVSNYEKIKEQRRIK